MSKNDQFIEAVGLSKWFGQVIAINDLGFSTNAPVIGLLGPNGAGKSTLIKILVGQIRPSQGVIRVFGHKPFQNRRLLSVLGYVPEHDRFYEELSPLDFVSLLTRLHGYSTSKAVRLSEESLEVVGLTEKKDQPIKTLSHGMRQRLKVAQALAHKPEFLVMDEPLTGLDPAGRARMISLFSELSQKGTRLLVSSHVLHELEVMTSDILLLNRGRMVARGEVKQIRDMIDSHPHRIALQAERPRELGQALLAFEHVVRVEIEGDSLVVETSEPDKGYAEIDRLAASGEYKVRTLMSLDDNLEAVFKYLVK